MQNTEQGHHGGFCWPLIGQFPILLASHWLNHVSLDKRDLRGKVVDQLPFTFLCPVRRKRGRKFAMTSSLQKCQGCWHVSNLLIMFHSHPRNWGQGREQAEDQLLLIGLYSHPRLLIGHWRLSVWGRRRPCQLIKIANRRSTHVYCNELEDIR